MNNKWIQTYTGKPFWPLKPRIEDIDIIDIAHHLSLICRYNGACKWLYSVGQHSVLGSYYCEYPVEFLLHDAHEAYKSDESSPVKNANFIRKYLNKRIEKRLDSVIYPAFGLNEKTGRKEIKKIDHRILVDEQNQVMNRSEFEWSQTKGVEPLGVKIEYWEPEKTEREFLKRFYELKGDE